LLADPTEPAPATAPALIPTSTPTVESPTSYDLHIVKRGDDGLFVVNRTAEDFPLVWLQLGDGNGAVYGTEWGVEMLASAACVAAWKDKGDPQLPDGLTCNQVGEYLTRGGGDTFWKEEFSFYYGGEPIGTCAGDQSECAFSIPIQASDHLLLIARRGDDGLFVVNYTIADLSLSPLRLAEGEEEEEEGEAVHGDEWDIATLARGDCVTVWKDDHEPRPPDGLTCNRVGELLSRRGRKQFWKSAYNIYYNEELVSICEKEWENCVVNLGPVLNNED
jgi:hypothetical protein